MVFLQTENQMQQPMADYHIYMIGICGAGMCGIAEALLHFGYSVSGSDMQVNCETGEHLQTLGIKINSEHKESNIKNVDIIVYSSAIKESNLELIAAKKQNLPCMGRAEMLADLIRYYYGIAVAGAHGKTTTANIIQHIFTSADKSPSYIVGGRLLSQKSSTSIGTGDCFIIEADESDASFKHIHPVIAVITNIDKDHMSTYNYSFDLLQQAYIDFVHNIPFYGLVVACGDDLVLQKMLPRIHRKVITYGLNNNCDYYATNIEQVGCQTNFILHCPDKKFPISLNLSGDHNVCNALSAIVIALHKAIDIAKIQTSLKTFPGVSRRFNHYDVTLNNKKLHIIDDYGHHPTEIKETIKATKNLYPKQRLILAFQPHRYSRTRDLFDDFTSTLEGADILIVSDTYSAGEAIISDYDSHALCRSIRERKKINPIFAADNNDILSCINNISEDGDIILIQGAGDIAYLLNQILKLC